jgi:hypothetical protein
VVEIWQESRTNFNSGERKITMMPFVPNIGDKVRVTRAALDKRVVYKLFEGRQGEVEKIQCGMPMVRFPELPGGTPFVTACFSDGELELAS